MSGYVLHLEAYTDLAAIVNFIAEDSFDAASQLIEEIHQSVQRLLEFPRQGHQRLDLASEAILFRTVGSYLIAYVPDQTPCSYWPYFTDVAVPGRSLHSSAAVIFKLC